MKMELYCPGIQSVGQLKSGLLAAPTDSSAFTLILMLVPYERDHRSRIPLLTFGSFVKHEPQVFW